MSHKKYIVWGTIFVIISIVGVSFFLTEKSEKPVSEQAPEPAPVQKAERPKEEAKPAPVKPPVEPTNKIPEKKFIPDNQDLSFSGISALASVPVNIREKVNTIINNSQNLFLLNRTGDKIIIIVENTEAYPRHEIAIKEINIPNAEEKNIPAGYNSDNEETEHDIWEYDNTSHLPIMHIKYSQEGENEYTEFWHYSAENPIKYEMKDKNGNILSIKKETPEGDMGLRIENIFYDSEGNTKMNLSAVYEGNDLKRMTYFNAEKPEESSTVISEYSNGQKTTETVYSPDFRIKNIYKAGYTEGELKDITVFDNNNREIEKILTK